MAEYATLHADNVVKIDQQLPLDKAALIGCGVMTGVGAAVNTAKVEPGSVTVVFGCGGVGLNVIQGCTVAMRAHDRRRRHIGCQARDGTTIRRHPCGQQQK
jgi:Zn-dependent alcohol dehydrogenase